MKLVCLTLWHCIDYFWVCPLGFAVSSHALISVNAVIAVRLTVNLCPPPLFPFQFEYLTGGLALAHRFLAYGEEYSHEDSQTFRSSMNVLCNQIMSTVASESVDSLCKSLSKDLWEVRTTSSLNNLLCRCLCTADVGGLCFESRFSGGFRV